MNGWKQFRQVSCEIVDFPYRPRACEPGWRECVRGVQRNVNRRCVTIGYRACATDEITNTATIR